MLLDDLVNLTERHRVGCRFYRDYIDSMFASTATPTSLADLPYLPVRAFKQFDLKSVPDDDVYKVMRSSGTSGTHSQNLPRPRHRQASDRGAEPVFC